MNDRLSDNAIVMAQQQVALKVWTKPTVERLGCSQSEESPGNSNDGETSFS